MGDLTKGLEDSARVFTGSSTRKPELNGTIPNAVREPRAVLRLVDAIALIVGIVIGAGIFRTPSMVAANTGSEGMYLATWLFGGVVSLTGALCYAELTAAFPSAGGEYHFLNRSYGKRLAFMFAWARLSVVQTGSIAILAFIFGDYASQVWSLGAHSSEIYAALVIISLTILNIMGVTFGTGTQKLLTTVEVAGILLVIIAGLFLVPQAAPAAEPTNTGGTTGLAMVVVLLTYGGWNEAGYISAEMRSGSKRMAKALIISIAIITGIYLLINLTYLRALGMDQMAGSEAVAVDLMKIAFGNGGVILIGILVAVSSLTSANATIFTGARTSYAVGRDFPVLKGLARWNRATSAPVNAFLLQGGIALFLVSMGLFTRSGFETVVEYTAPVFWFFFLLTGISVFILRKKEPHAERPFKVPLYPVVPIIFCLTCGYLLYSSLVFTGYGALAGIAILLIGLLLFPFLKRPAKPDDTIHPNSHHNASQTLK
jgi:basic amino acid/polyamine antiporter, APA family